MIADIDKLKPVGTNLLIKMENKAKQIQAKTGIILSDDTAKRVGESQETSAIVLAVGTNCTLGIEPGHTVIFRPIHVQAIKVAEHEDGSDMIVVPEADIMAITNYGE